MKTLSTSEATFEDARLEINQTLNGEWRLLKETKMQPVCVKHVMEWDSAQAQNMSLLTELEILIGWFPTNMPPLTGLKSRTHILLLIKVLGLM
jgi:hypothetical protein